MIRNLLKKHKKSIITPSIASGVLLVFTITKIPHIYHYTSAYIAELIVALLFLALSEIVVFRSKKDVDKKEEKYSKNISSELQEAYTLRDSLDEKNVDGYNNLTQHINNLIKEKTESSQKKLKKQKDEIDAAQEKYELALKEKEQSKEDVEKKIDNTVKAAHDANMQ